MQPHLEQGPHEPNNRVSAALADTELHERGILAKETHHQVIRFAPPLTITKEELRFALDHAREVLSA